MIVSTFSKCLSHVYWNTIHSPPTQIHLPLIQSHLPFICTPIGNGCRSSRPSPFYQPRVLPIKVTQSLNLTTSRIPAILYHSDVKLPHYLMHRHTLLHIPIPSHCYFPYTGKYTVYRDVACCPFRPLLSLSQTDRHWHTHYYLLYCCLLPWQGS